MDEVRTPAKEQEKCELVKQIRNRCEIFLVMETLQPRGWSIWQYTLLEDLIQDAQSLTEFCVVKEVI